MKTQFMPEKSKGSIDPTLLQCKAILWRLRNGNASVSYKAFETIHHHYYPMAKLYAQKFVPVEDAGEVAHITLIKLWENRNRFRKWKHLVSFIYVTTRNQCLNLLRDENSESKKRKAYSLHLATDLTEDEMDIHDRVLHMRLNDAIEELPGKKKQTVSLLLQGYKIAEVASKLNISRETAQNYKSAAFSLLRQKLRVIMRILFFLYL